MMDLSSVCNASNLEPADKATLAQLVGVLKDNASRNAGKMTYYEDLNPLKNLGMAVPEKFLGTINTSVGWAAKAVDYLASRSVFDGFIAEGDAAYAIDAIARANDLSALYQMAVSPELVHGVGFWTVTHSDECEHPVINYRDAETASALWDYKRKRIKAGMVVEDFRLMRGSSFILEPCMVVMHTDECFIEITRGLADEWVAEYKPHPAGRPLMEPMCYRPTIKKPFGKSRISRTVMAITDEMQREIARTALHSECYTAPYKYALGAPDEMFDMDKFSLAYNSFMLIGKDKDGDVPQVGQFQAASMEPHVAAQNHLMSRMAAETALPVAAFGLSSNGYTSSDALRASTDDLIIEAEALNESNAKALANVAKLALAIHGNKSVNDLDEDENAVSARFKDPSKPSTSSLADAMTKIASVVPEFGGTSVFWERMGMDEDERRRINADVRMNKGQDALAQWFSGSAEKAVSDENKQKVD